MTRLASLSFALLGVGGFSAPAQAALTAGEVLNQFNLVVLGNSSSTSDVEGRTFIGGSLRGGTYAMLASPPVPASQYAGLTVLGDANEVNRNNPNINVNNLGVTVLGNLEDANVNNGPSAVQGNATSVNFNGAGGSFIGGVRTNVNQNSGQLSAADASAAFTNATSTDFAAVMGAASQQLSLLTGNSFVTFNGNRATFTANPDANGVAVFDLTANDVATFAKGEFEFLNFGAASTVIINTDEASITTGANFLGGSAVTIATRTLWNFYNATTLTLNAQFGGAILATGAHLTNSNNIEGSAVVGSLTQRGEFHLQPYGGQLPNPVPVPAALWLLGSALAGMTGVARRRAA